MRGGSEVPRVPRWVWMLVAAWFIVFAIAVAEDAWGDGDLFLPAIGKGQVKATATGTPIPTAISSWTPTPVPVEAGLEMAGVPPSCVRQLWTEQGGFAYVWPYWEGLEVKAHGLTWITYPLETMLPLRGYHFYLRPEPECYGLKWFGLVPLVVKEDGQELRTNYVGWPR